MYGFLVAKKGQMSQRNENYTTKFRNITTNVNRQNPEGFLTYLLHGAESLRNRPILS